MQHNNYWFEQPVQMNFTVGIPPKLDVIIIGGGIAGISLLNTLISSTKFTVGLVSSSPIGYKASGRCPGIVTSDGDLSDIKRANNQIILSLIKNLDIECDLTECGAFKFGNKTSHQFDDDEMHELLDGMNNAMKGCSGDFIPGDFILNPYKFLIHLASKSENLNKFIISNAEVISVKKQGNQFVTEIKDRGLIKSKYVVYCNNNYGEKYLKPVRYQTIVTKELGYPLLDYILHFKDCMIRPIGNRLMMDCLESEGNFYDGEVNMNLLTSQKNLLRTLFCVENNTQCVWANVSYPSKDGKPIVGRLKSGEYLNIGHDHMGINTVFYAAQLLKDLIVSGKSDLISEPFNPNRF